jgi:hypothetical protein
VLLLKLSSLPRFCRHHHPPPETLFLRLCVSTDSFWSCSRDLSSHFSCSFLPFFLFACSHRIRSIILPCKNFPPSTPKQRLDCAAKWREAILFHSSSRLLHSPRRLLIPPKNLYWTTTCACKLAPNSHYCKTQATGRPFVSAVLYRFTGISLQEPLRFLEADAQLVLNVFLAAVFSHRHSTPV